MGRVHDEVRLLQAAADRPAVRPAAGLGRARPNGRLLPPTRRKIDVGRMAIGQDKLLVTPLQMATVAATIANGGVRMEPHITQKIVDPDGRTHRRDRGRAGRARDERGRRPRALTAMMKNVVKEGTGTAAALEGVDAGRQDRHRGDRHRARHQRPLVHRLHRRVRRRRRARARPGRHGRRRRGADRQAGAGGAGRMSVHGIARDTVVDERYKVLNRIGSGGMADVYCAEDLQLGRRVALKLLYRRFAEDAEFVERFRREASSAAGPPAPQRRRRLSTAASSTTPTTSRWSSWRGARSSRSSARRARSSPTARSTS